MTLGGPPCWLSWGMRLLTLLSSWGRLNPMTVGPLGSCLVTMGLVLGASGISGDTLRDLAMPMERGIMARGRLTFFLTITGPGDLKRLRKGF